MTRASELFGGGGGIHFADPRKFQFVSATAANLLAYDASNTQRTAATTEFFTEMARRGLQEQTDWVADTYKTLLNVTSGAGHVASIIGPTAGGSSTTTFEITVDGIAYTIAVPVSGSGLRACAFAGYAGINNYTTAIDFVQPRAEALDATKTYFTDIAYNGAASVLPWNFLMRGIPMLEYKNSLLIRAKHSANITNSTATAYSAIQYKARI